MPRHKGTNVCHLHKDLDCVHYISRHFIGRPSNCLPTCNSISYDTSVTMSKLVNKTPSDNHRYASISIVFKDQQYFASIRSELYGTMDFIAQAGGILGLFMGISMLNLVEIIYFATIRVIFRSKDNDEK